MKIQSPKGFQAAGVHCGIKKAGLDLALLVSDRPAQTAIVKTRNVMQAAPLTFNQAQLEKTPTSSAILINSGVANAGTGEDGFAACQDLAQAFAESFGMDPDALLLASTGVIGLSLPLEKIKRGFDALQQKLTPQGFEEAAKAIMTTDTVPKMAWTSVRIQDQEVRLLGLAKGSGMICPNMSTMLAFVLTDATIDASLLQAYLQKAVALSFNAITVDGDTSTNDTVILLANGASQCQPLVDQSPEGDLFQQELTALCQDLAKQIARDGEGASRLIEVRVKGCGSDGEARQCAKAVAGSSLVKTAVFGRDPNWGRIACALGYAGVDFKPQDLGVQIGDVWVCRAGREIGFDETLASQAMATDKVVITCHIGDGPGQGMAWGCDLSYDYVRINADYRS